MSADIVGIVGKARSGKDTFAGVLVREGGFVRVAFADEMKLNVAEFLGISVETLERRKDEFRATLQEYGSRMRRECCTSYWISRAADAVDAALYANRDVVVTDVRYRNEADWIHAQGGVIVKRERPEHDGLTGELGEHSSETELDEIEVDFVCDCGTVARIERHARDFIARPRGD